LDNPDTRSGEFADGEVTERRPLKPGTGISLDGTMPPPDAGVLTAFAAFPYP
jgi:hypothetical protein